MQDLDLGGCHSGSAFICSFVIIIRCAYNYQGDNATRTRRGPTLSLRTFIDHIDPIAYDFLLAAPRSEPRF